MSHSQKIKTGAKRLAENECHGGSGGDHHDEQRPKHIDPRALCKHADPLLCCFDAHPNPHPHPHERPSKRTKPSLQGLQACQSPRGAPTARAPASFTLDSPVPSALSHSHSHSHSGQQFPSDCFEQFCRDCDDDVDVAVSVAAPCASPCSLPPCPDQACKDNDKCFDPHCDDKDDCSPDCPDQVCTKSACPDVPCYCSSCDVAECPLGEPGNTCHSAHTAPTASGTIFCFDKAPCHFQDGSHSGNSLLSLYGGYPCYAQSHHHLAPCNVTARSSSVATPVLSPGDYTSLESAFSAHSSPAPPLSASQYGQNISDAHGPFEDLSCYGERVTTLEQSRVHRDSWNLALSTRPEDAHQSPNHFSSIGFGLANAQPQMSPVNPAFPTRHNSGLFGNTLQAPIYGFNGNHNSDSHPWVLPHHHFQSPYQNVEASVPSKLDYLASAVQAESSKPDLFGTAGPGLRPTSSASAVQAEFSKLDPFCVAGPGSPPTSSASVECTNDCVCRWKVAYGAQCGHLFENPQALHNHIKTEHVDKCTRCFCQWEGCESHDKDFKQRSKLSRHLLGHAGYRPYACSHEGCNKTFATNQAKDNHERTHTGDRPYTCTTCGYKTTTHTQLQTHISALHLNKKPHKCRFCNFSCADSSNLSKHEKTHQDLRPFRCPQPGCTFKPEHRWENFKRHLRRSGHCPLLLEDDSEECIAYRESVRREMEEWHRRNDGRNGTIEAKKKGSRKDPAV